MSNAYLKLNDVESAIKTYKRAISLNPISDELHIKVGNLYYTQERYQEAQHEYEELSDRPIDLLNSLIAPL